MTHFGRFRTATSVWLDLATKLCTKLEVGYKRPELSISGVYHQFKFTDGFEVIHSVCCNLEEVAYCFWGLPISSLCYTSCKINDLNSICLSLLSWSQLPNPSDLPCLNIVAHFIRQRSFFGYFILVLHAYIFMKFTITYCAEINT